MSENIYGFDETTEVSSSKPAFTPGIHENVTLASVTFGSMSEGKDPLLQITFNGEKGEELRWVVWPLDVDRIKSANRGDKTHKRDNARHGFVKGAVVTPTDSVKMAADNWNAKLKHLATTFHGEQAVIQGSSYADVSNKYVALMNKADRSKKLRLKVVLDYKDYPSIPNYPPFVELMEEATKLRMGAGDKVVATSNGGSSPSNPEATTFSAESPF